MSDIPDVIYTHSENVPTYCEKKFGPFKNKYLSESQHTAEMDAALEKQRDDLLDKIYNEFSKHSISEVDAMYDDFLKRIIDELRNINRGDE